LQAQLVLLSGLFFEGQWKLPFNKTFTKTEPFHDANGEKIGDVNMMFHEGPFSYAAVKDLGCHVIELPYGNAKSEPDRLSMILLVPRKGLSLLETIENIKKHGMERIYQEIESSKAEYEDDVVEVYLPRFETETSLSLIEVMQKVSFMFKL